MAATCGRGHALTSKIVTGGIAGTAKHHCSRCMVTLAISRVRHSCKPCHFHLCENCRSEWVRSVVSLDSSRLSLAESAGSTLDSDGEELGVCKYGAECYNREPEHRLRFRHPNGNIEGPPGKRLACKHGVSCYRKKAAHLEQFVHPGDRNYRIGLVCFKAGHTPEFESLWQVFQYYDPDESGHLSKEEFSEALAACQIIVPGFEAPGLDKAWQDAGGPSQGYVNFTQFVAWTKDHLGLEYPMGLEESSSASSRPCRFRSLAATGKHCSCPGFQAVEESSCCSCGHKPSMHRSDFAMRSFTTFLERTCCQHWTPGQEGLVKIEDSDVLAKLQGIVNASHKPAPDNWTRDRGCSVHGVNGCMAACASKHRSPVPSGYVLLSAYRNQNQDLWQKYTLVRTAIAEECARPSKDKHEPRSVTTCGWRIETDLDSTINEWYLFHGTSASKCKKICSTNFRLNLAGTGATWKDPGQEKGTPLYGFGVYLAEHITKADEYSDALLPDEVQSLPVIAAEAGCEVHTVLLCRVVGGRTNVVTSNEIEVDKLRKDVFEGSYNSVFGDRVTTLGKPYREIVVYDKDQCYPEFLLTYARSYD